MSAYQPEPSTCRPTPVKVASGVDAFYFSGHGTVPPWLVEKLAGLRAKAAEERMPQPVDLGGVEFMVQGFGRRQYTYGLVHPYGWLGLTESSQSPAFRVEPEAVALHGLGARETVDWFEQVVRWVDPVTKFTASRVDLFCDVSGWAPRIEDRERMVCRSKSRISHENGGLTGLTFGRRKTGGVMLRIYDKRRQVFEKGLDYWYSIWGDRFDPALPLWRAEFELGRNGLKTYGIDLTSDVFDRIGGMWASITSDLYRLAVPTRDQTCTRWPTDPAWEIVQNAGLRHDAVALDRLTEAKRSGTLRTLEPMVTGVLSSVAALSGATTIDETFDTAYDMIEHYEGWTARSFSERVEEKRRR